MTFQRVTSEQEIYEGEKNHKSVVPRGLFLLIHLCNVCLAPLISALIRLLITAQLHDLLQLKQENAYLTTIARQIGPYILSIARVKERLEHRLFYSRVIYSAYIHVIV